MENNNSLIGRRRQGKIIRCYEEILLHIPHSSIAFPSESGYSFQDLDKEERLLIDYYTDELFIPRQKWFIESFVFPYCRLYCDVERLVKDPLEYKGLGISYNRTVDSDDLPWEVRSFSTLTEAFSYYADFHAYVTKRMVELAIMNRNLLIDCHSFSALPNLLCSDPPDIDICIGYNEDDTKPDQKVIDAIVTHFKACGYKVGINIPFSNSKTFAAPVYYQSVMIEVNKSLYMNEFTLEKKDSFEKLKEEIESLYDIIYAL